MRQDVLAYIIGSILIGFGALPFIDIKIMAPGQYFVWYVFLAGILGIYLCFIKINLFIKIAAVYGFANCFFSTAPLVSFISYFSFLACLYFFVLCYKLKNHFIVLNMLQALLYFNLFMLAMKMIGADVLTNFNESVYFGTAGQHMQSASFICILSAALIPRRSFNVAFPFVASIVCNSIGAFVSGLVGLSALILKQIKVRQYLLTTLLLATFGGVWMFTGGDWAEHTNPSGRLGVWMISYDLSSNHPIVGYGIGTFKYLFHPLSKLTTYPWKTAHNCWVQILFEAGIVGFGISVSYAGYLIAKLINMIRSHNHRNTAAAFLSGLAIIASNMFYHFPTRQIQSVLLIIYFLAICQRMVDHGSR